MSCRATISQLKSQSTWRLLLLSLITVWIYHAHYMKRQTRIINQQLAKEQQISDELVNVILILAYVTALLFVPYFLVEEGHPIERISDILDLVWMILSIVWAFKARNRMNMLLALTKNKTNWFHGFWTLLFTTLYFNYKINKLNDTLAEPDDAPNEDSAVASSS